MFSDLFSRVSAWTLIAAGIVALIYPIVQTVLHVSDDAVILIVLGLICIGVGAERLGPMERLMNAVGDNRHLHLLRTKGDVYLHAQRMVKECPNATLLRATDLFPTRQKLDSKEFESFTKTVVEKIAQTEDLNYRLVFATDSKGFGEEALTVRRKIIASHPSAKERFHIRTYDKPFPLEVLMSEKSVVIAFPGDSEGNPLGKGVLIDDEELASRFGRWYDEFLWGVSVTHSQ